MVDQQYCSSEHRKEADWPPRKPFATKRKSSLVGFEIEAPRAAHRIQRRADGFDFRFHDRRRVAGRGTADARTRAGTAFPPVSLDPAVKRGLFERVGDSISEVIRSRAPVTLHQDFDRPEQLDRLDCSRAASRSTIPADRVDDPRWCVGRRARFYASGIGRRRCRIIRWSSAAPSKRRVELGLPRDRREELLRHQDPDHQAGSAAERGPGPLCMMNGREWDRVQLPLPLTLERGGNYRVRVSVQDDHFITYLNGQVISSWSDKRLQRGGVGFFDDADDPQKVAWVNLSERDSFLGRMLAHFSLIISPAALYDSLP